MTANRLVPLGFLFAALLLAVFPVVLGAGAARPVIDGVLVETYSIVRPWSAQLSFPAASILFGMLYWAGARLAGMVYRPALLWAHLALWTAGSALLFAPPFLDHGAQASESYDFAGNFSRLHILSTAGYCVTLISLAIFAICIGQAILQRIRRAKPL
ncbi:MAG: hypothetical protein C0456_09695 [Hyphomonas sp.]|uniref:hypothetical protein n=1 Tax=Hyphomonas sp. TaxID=87 RepID=UPI001D40A3B6|nr:hypothetical protein [Hyphomonas sp.]MBA4226891.1 hypothetical protein [Hyphomonas sp.]